MAKHWRWFVVAGLICLTALYTIIRAYQSIPQPQPAEAQKPPTPAPAPAPARPLEKRALTLAPLQLDFGEVALGKTQYATVQVSNALDRPVQVYRVLSECVCIAGEVDPAVLHPKGSSTLTVSFTGIPGKRAYQGHVSLITDETGPSRYEVDVKGRILQDFIVENETLLFGRVERNVERILTTTVRRKEGKPFEIREVRTARPEFQFTWKPLEEGRKDAWKLTIAAKGAIAGTFVDEVSVVTDQPLEASPLITLHFEVEGDVSCTPAVALAGVSSATGKAEGFETVLRAKAGGKLEIQSVRESRDLAVDFASEDLPDGATRLKIQITADIPPGAPFGELLITTNKQSEPVRLPYRINLPPPPGSKNP